MGKMLCPAKFLWELMTLNKTIQMEIWLGPEGYCKIPYSTSTDTESHEVWFNFSLTSELLCQQCIRSSTSFLDPVYTCWISYAVSWNSSLPYPLTFDPGDSTRQNDVLAFKIKYCWFVRSQKVIHPAMWISTTVISQLCSADCNTV